jgi:hypothetical protein
MIGTGVIAESYVSFDITWASPGQGQQPKWDQTDQFIELHTTDIYPDLLFSKAVATATYFKYTSIADILGVVKQICAIIDTKIKLAKQNEALALPPGPTQVTEPEVTPDETAKDDEVDIEKPEQASPDKPESQPEKPIPYTVNVIGDRLRFIEAQSPRSGDVTIRYRVSNNITKVVGEEQIDNSAKIKAIVKIGGVLGQTVEFTYADFNTEDGQNLLVEILPSVELRFTPGENASVPKAETADDSDEWLLQLAKKVQGTRAERDILAANSAAKSELVSNK